MAELQPGQPAPDFDATTGGGRRVRQVSRHLDDVQRFRREAKGGGPR
jgi:hypothetical protein